MGYPEKVQEIEQVMQDLAAYGPEKVILFGSAARGDVDEYSDIDLIVIKETDKRFVQRLVGNNSRLVRQITIWFKDTRTTQIEQIYDRV